jgi:uncharacterized membrane protein YphA (DoxX/SURF4 family)
MTQTHDAHTSPAQPTSYAVTDRPTSRTAGERRKGGGRNVALWVLQVLIAAAFIMAAVTKVTAYPQAVHTFDQIGLGHWFMYLIGSLELAGAIAVLIPRLCGLAGLAFVGLLIGATITELLVSDVTGAATPAVYVIPVTIIAWARRDRTTRLIKQLTGMTGR